MKQHRAWICVYFNVQHYQRCFTSVFPFIIWCWCWLVVLVLVVLLGALHADEPGDAVPRPSQVQGHRVEAVPALRHGQVREWVK